MTCTIEIDRSVPLQQRQGRGQHIHPVQYVLEKLKVGDSFLYPACTFEDYNCLRSIIHGYGNRHGLKFSTRTVTDSEGVDRLRIWRVK